MRIKVSCPSCFHEFSVSDEYLGRRVKCTACREPVRVTEPDDDDEPRSRHSGKSEKNSKRKTSSSKGRGGNGLAIGLGIGGGIVVLGLIVIVLVLMQPGRPAQDLAENPPMQPPATVPATVPAVAEAQQPIIVATPAQPAVQEIAKNAEIAQAAPAPNPSEIKSVPPTPSSAPVNPAPAAVTTVVSDADLAKLDTSKLQGVPQPSQQKLDLPELIQRVEPSVVKINVVSSKGPSIGSGFVVSTDGTVVTNYHVITDALRAEVEFADGTTGKVVGYRHLIPKADIAIIKIDVPASKLKPVPLAPGLPLKGESVATFGNPHGLSFTTTEGNISAIRKEADLSKDMGLDMIGTWLQFSAPISPGNSGGPLVDKFGNVVGINTMQLSVGQNLNFAVSSQEVIKALNAAPDKVKELKPEDIPHVERNLERKIASDEFDTERGRRLFAEVKEIVLLSGASIQNFDPQGTIWDRVILRSQRAVEKSGIELSFGNPRPDVAILVVVLHMSPSRKGTDGTQELSVSAELTCVDPLAKKNESPLAKVWKSEQKIGTISLSSAALGKVPQTVDAKLSDFFGSFRTAYNRAVKATKEAKNSADKSP